MARSPVCMAAHRMAGACERIVFPVDGPIGINRVAAGWPHQWDQSSRGTDLDGALAADSSRDRARWCIPAAALLAMALGEVGCRIAHSLWRGRIFEGNCFWHIVSGPTSWAE